MCHKEYNNKINLTLKRESVCWKKNNECFSAFKGGNKLSLPTCPDFVSGAVNFRNGDQDNDIIPLALSFAHVPKTVLLTPRFLAHFNNPSSLCSK